MNEEKRELKGRRREKNEIKKLKIKKIKKNKIK